MQYLPVPPTALRVLRVARVLRILRLLKNLKGLRDLVMALVFAFPALINVATLLGLVIFMYGHHTVRQEPLSLAPLLTSLVPSPRPSSDPRVPSSLLLCVHACTFQLRRPRHEHLHLRGAWRRSQRGPQL